MPALPDSLTSATVPSGCVSSSRRTRDAVLRACQDPELLRWTAPPDPYTAEDADRLMDEVRAQWEEGRGVELAIAVDDDLVGSTHLVFHGVWRASVAYWLADRGARSRVRDAMGPPADPLGIRDVPGSRPHRALEHPRQRGG